MRNGGLSKDEHRTNEKRNLLMVVFLLDRPELPIHAPPRICVLRLPRLGFVNSLEESVCNPSTGNIVNGSSSCSTNQGTLRTEVVVMSTFLSVQRMRIPNQHTTSTMCGPKSIGVWERELWVGKDHWACENQIVNSSSSSIICSTGISTRRA